MERRKMGTLDKDMQELRKRLSEGAIQRAYKGIISYMSHLQTVFGAQRGKGTISALYQGHFDMSYFALFPGALKKRNLKIAIVFNYQTFRFEAWLAARNRPLQRHYWELFRSGGYKKHPLVKPGRGVDAIVETVLAEDYSLEAQDKLTAHIVEGVAVFERDIVAFLSEIDAR
jgi:hypothetical protein